MNKVRIMFLLRCIPSRLLLAYTVKEYSNLSLGKAIAFLLASIGCGFLIIYIFGLRKTGIETGGTKIWWNSLRPVHSLLYLSAAFLVYRNQQNEAWKLLMIDVIIGLLAHLMKT